MHSGERTCRSSLRVTRTIHRTRVDEALVGANVRRRVLPAQHEQIERWALKQPAQLQEARRQQTVRGQEAEDVVAQLGDHFII